MKLADLPCLVDLVFVGNPLEEKYSAEGTWMDEASKRLLRLKKLDGTTACRIFLLLKIFYGHPSTWILMENVVLT